MLTRPTLLSLGWVYSIKKSDTEESFIIMLYTKHNVTHKKWNIALIRSAIHIYILYVFDMKRIFLHRPPIELLFWNTLWNKNIEVTQVTTNEISALPALNLLGL